MRAILREITDSIRSERPRVRLDLILISVGVSAVGPIAFIQRKGLVIALTLIALGFIVMPGRAARLRRAWGSTNGVLCLAFTVWALVTLAWAPQLTLLIWLQVAAVIVLGLVVVVGFDDLSPAYRALMLVCFSGSMACLVAAHLFEIASGGALLAFLRGWTVVNPGASAQGTVLVALLIWIWALTLRVLWGRWWPALIGLALSAAAIYGLNMRGAQAAFAVALMLAALTAPWPRPALRVLALGVALYALAAPWLSLDWLTVARLDAAGFVMAPSWWHRIGIWSFTADRITQAPFFGHGFQAARWIGGQGLSFTVPQFGNSPMPSMPLHPHNGFIQLWLELGPLGLVLMLALWWRVTRWLRAYTDDRWIAAAGAATIGAALAIGSISFGVWQRWWIATLFLAAALFRLAAGFLRDRTAKDVDGRNTKER